jgi:hypothetical protein
MARVMVTSDDGSVVLDERIRADDFTSEHFRRCLADRLGWAAQDAEPEPAAGELVGRFTA